MIQKKLYADSRAVGALLAAGMLAASVFFSPPVTARTLEEVVAAKILRVVVYKDNRPFSWIEGSDVKGIDVDIGRAIAKKLGVEAEIMARMTGEKVDDDLRFNIWKGPVAEGGVGDVMLHVPVDRELIARNTMAVIGNAYFEERVALAIDAERTGPAPDFNVFKKQKIGVQFSTVADYFLMRYEDGALMSNIVHHTKLEAGVGQFVAKETAALLGVQSDIEGVLSEKGLKAHFVNPPMPGIVRSSWVVGTAVKDSARDLGYAIGTALEELRSSGELEKIFASHGVTYVAPTVP
jgi:polar amino acid transport system substrate-binding protein